MVLTLRQRILLTALSAIFTVFAFPNFLDRSLAPSTAFFAWFSLAPFLLALRGVSPQQGAWLGFLFGFLHLGGILYWIAFLEAAQYLKALAWAVLVGYLSLYFALFGALQAFIARRLGEWAYGAAPFLWLALEHFRGTRPWGGFSWGEIGYSQAPVPVLLTASSWAGVHGLTFLIVAVNAAWAEGLHRWRGSKRGPVEPMSLWARPHLFPILGAGFLAVLLMTGVWTLRNASLKASGEAVLLQPSVDQSVKWSREEEDAIYRKIGGMVARIEAPAPDLVVWPETAAPSYLLSSPRALQKVESIVRRSGTRHLVGCLHQEYSPWDELFQYNAAIPFEPDGSSGDFYGKRHLVPFGEFVPFQEQLGFLGPVVGDLGNFSPGPDPRNFNAGKFTYSPMICYEAVFPSDVRKAFRGEADVLVNISNDAWYGKTASAYQHALMAIAGAAGVRKPLLRASNAGICLATDPYGRILGSTALFEERSLRVEVVTDPGRRTLYARWGDWLPGLCWIVTLVLLGLAWRRRPGLRPER